KGGYTFKGTEVQIGYASAHGAADFVPVYDVAGGSVSWARAGASSFTIAGTLETHATTGGRPVPVWSSSTPNALAVTDVLGNGAALTRADTVKVAGVPFKVQSVGLAHGTTAGLAALRGQLQFDLGRTTLTVGVNGANYVYVDNSGIQMTGAGISVSKTFTVAG